MNIRSKPFAVLLSVAVLFIWITPVHAAPTQNTPDRVEQSYKQLHSMQEQLIAAPWGKRSRMLDTRYQKVLGKYQADRGNLVTLSTKDLRLLFRAAAEMTFYTNDSDYLSAAERDLTILKSRNTKTTLEYTVLYRLYVRTRQFTKANALLDAHSSLDVTRLPPIKEEVPDSTEDPTVLSISGHDGTIVHKSFHMGNAPQILVVAHPLCHFTQNAVRDLVRHPKVWQAIAQHSTWIAPQDGRIDIKAFQGWNGAIPQAQIDIAYRQSEWAMIDTWGTPAFYFLNEGKVVSKIDGWPDGGHIAEIVQDMRKLGLKVDPHPTPPVSASSR